MALKKKAPETTENEKNMTEAEAQAITADTNRRNAESASIERMQDATRIVSEKFGLDPDYSVTKFNDKGKVVDLTLENGEFRLAVTIKNSEAHGMHPSAD